MYVPWPDWFKNASYSPGISLKKSLKQAIGFLATYINSPTINSHIHIAVCLSINFWCIQGRLANYVIKKIEGHYIIIQYFISFM